MSDERVRAEEGWTEVRLVPIEVFGTDDCCQHPDMTCEAQGYGLSDAVSPWSDCNRADGRMYRVERVDEPLRTSRAVGDTLTIRVRTADLPWLERRHGDKGTESV